MLTLEKNPQSKEIHIAVVRYSERFWTKQLTQAFTVALLLHLFGFFLFSIPLFTNFGNPNRLPPAFVTTDLPIHSVISDGSFQSEKKIDKQWKPKKIKISLANTLFPLPDPSSFFMSEFDTNPLSLSPLFADVERIGDWRLPSFDDPINVAQIIEIHPIGVERPVVKGPTYLAEVDLSFENDPILYDVRIEGKTGKIIWFEPLHPAKSPEVKQSCEKALDKFRFVKDRNKGEILKGVIEFSPSHLLSPKL